MRRKEWGIFGVAVFTATGPDHVRPCHDVMAERKINGIGLLMFYLLNLPLLIEVVKESSLHQDRMLCDGCPKSIIAL